MTCMRLALFSRAQQFMAKKAAKAAATEAPKKLARAKAAKAEARVELANEAELANARAAKAAESTVRVLGEWMKAHMPMKANKADIRVPLSEFMSRVESLGITNTNQRVNLLLQNLTGAGLMIVVRRS